MSFALKGTSLPKPPAFCKAPSLCAASPITPAARDQGATRNTLHQEGKPKIPGCCRLLFPFHLPCRNHRAEHLHVPPTRSGDFPWGTEMLTAKCLYIPGTPLRMKKSQGDKCTVIMSKNSHSSQHSEHLPRHLPAALEESRRFHRPELPSLTPGI